MHKLITLEWEILSDLAPKMTKLTYLAKLQCLLEVSWIDILYLEVEHCDISYFDVKHILTVHLD